MQEVPPAQVVSRFVPPNSPVLSCRTSLVSTARPRSRQSEARMVTSCWRSPMRGTETLGLERPHTNRRRDSVRLRLAWAQGLIRPSGTVAQSHQIVYKTTWQDRNFPYPSRQRSRYGLIGVVGLHPLPMHLSLRSSERSGRERSGRFCPLFSFRFFSSWEQGRIPRLVSSRPWVCLHGYIDLLCSVTVLRALQ